MAQSYKTLLFLGASGAGKDTQADLLAKEYHWHKLATGDAIRDFLKTDDPLAKQLQPAYDRGEWLNDRDLYRLLNQALAKRTLAERVVFVGFVRRPTQIPLFSDLLQNIGRSLDKVVLFDVDAENSTERLLSRQRHDDHPEAIARRLQNYRETIAPIAEYYHQHRQLIRVNGNQTIPEVYAELKAKLGPHVKP